MYVRQINDWSWPWLTRTQLLVEPSVRGPYKSVLVVPINPTQTVPKNVLSLSLALSFLTSICLGFRVCSVLSRVWTVGLRPNSPFVPFVI